jgi:methylenetetrahydrofolate reductase (NADPH)
LASVHIETILRTAGRPVFSFEFFPPSTDRGEQALREALSTLGELAPDFVSVTQTGGSTRDYRLEITRWIKHEVGIEAMAHLTCVDATSEELRDTVRELQENGIENVLALRGDSPRGESWRAHPGGFEHAAELAALVRDEFGLCAGGACFPETHPEAPDSLIELQRLKAKVEAGASFLITQLFFDNDAYFRFVDAARFAGIEVPILPGIMPITNAAQIQRIAELSGAYMSPELINELQKRADDPESVAELGVAHATLQCADLLARGAPGIHFYTLNRSPATRAILSALRIQQPWKSAAASRTLATAG